jgi:hypothetical protein
MKNAVLWDEFRRSVRRLLIPANVVPSSPILVTLMEAVCSSETSILTRVTQRNIPEYGILNLVLHYKATFQTTQLSLSTVYVDLHARQKLLQRNASTRLHTITSHTHHNIR